MRLTILIIYVLGAAVLGTALLATECGARTKRYTLHGQVVKKNLTANQITVRGDEVPGFMAAMTMPYKVHDAAELRKVQVGDVISADLVTSSNGDDYWLEKIHIVDSSRRKR